MVYNLHLLTHIASSVLQSGPLWATSTFHFESNNGILLDYIHGTKDPIKQIYSKFSLSKFLLENSMESKAVENYSKKLDSKKHYVNSVMINSNTTLLGKGISINNYEEISSLIMNDNGNFLNYKKMVYNQELYVCSTTKQSNDSYIKLSDNNYALLTNILYNKDTNEVVVIVKCIDIDRVFHCTHIKSIIFTDRIKKISICDIMGKGFFIKNDKLNCISEFPNKIQKY
jgi:hypothetical protein